MNTKTFFALTMLLFATPVLAQKGTLGTRLKGLRCTDGRKSQQLHLRGDDEAETPNNCRDRRSGLDYTLSGQVQVSGTRAKGRPVCLERYP